MAADDPHPLTQLSGFFGWLVERLRQAKGKEAMEYAEFAVCIESGPGELKPILTGQVLATHVPGLLMDIARLNDTMKCLRVVVNNHLVKRLDIKASSFQVRGEPVYGN